MLKIKSGVKVAGMRPEALLAVIAARDLADFYGIDCVITEVTGGRHKKHSRHIVGLAVDLRNRDLDSAQKQQFARRLQKNLGSNYDVVTESTHIHVEFDPAE